MNFTPNLSTERFSQLQILRISWLHNFQQLEMKQEATPRLKIFSIEDCITLYWIPERLKMPDQGIFGQLPHIWNGTKDSITKLVSVLNSAKLEADVDVVVSPPFVYIDQVKNSLTDRIEISAQNSWVGKGGAFTGEISVEQLKDLGCKWVILGHSERRHVIGEDDQFIGKKAAYALSEGLGVIACIGEKLEEREAGKTFDVCFKQLKAFADAVPSWENIVIAYEPVWAIGTGKVATPLQAQEVHAAVRDWLKTNVSSDVASATRIIYGAAVLIRAKEAKEKQDKDGSHTEKQNNTKKL